MSMSGLNLISIITVSYNAASTIEQTILSVINQTYPNIEYIIIDGGSTDGTVDIIKKYSDKIAYWISESDKGIYDAMNKGIIKATGEWINFMNAGDTFYKIDVLDKVFSLTELWDKNVVYGGVNMDYGSYSKVIYPKKVTKYNPMPFNHQCVFVRASLLKEYMFDTTYRYAADYNFFCKILERGGFTKIHLIIANYLVDGVSSLHGISVNKERIRSNPNWYTFYLHMLYYRNCLIKCVLRIIGGKSLIDKVKQQIK